MADKTDGLTWRAGARVEKWTPEQVTQVRAAIGHEPTAEDLAARIAPAEVVDAPGNLLTTAGLTRITSLITGGGGQAATNTAARIGVGNGAGSAVIGDTDLSASAGAGNRYFQPMDATYPQVAAGVTTFRATFGASDGNFAWNEWGVDIGTPTVSGGTTVNATLLNHKTSAGLGTKANGAVWTFTVTITLT
ncbi:hypothetical protein [Actinomadura litoris]|uniref:hypothetical protein n=1 Tax=Actinomadura litoris TaxID=2678616 RepID=UPI001FA7A622|nr:hypothetical protein [Actinomadura litoris]